MQHHERVRCRGAAQTSRDTRTRLTLRCFSTYLARRTDERPVALAVGASPAVVVVSSCASISVKFAAAAR